MGERWEALIRIPIIIVTYIIVEIWELVTFIGALLHLALILIAGKRIKSLAKFSNVFATYQYTVYKYAYFATNKRPFPFNEFPKELEPADLKKKR
ncbi:MAG TPA: DUF4389 domain-containing protein [Candidatus Nanoarchaeia archaeon]|nr:DUF4389 domain-containing protein [Candidatus Nanoarchaeia archaeon]